MFKNKRMKELLVISRHAARKLRIMYERRECSPRAELDDLIAVEQEIIEILKL